MDTMTSRGRARGALLAAVQGLTIAVAMLPVSVVCLVFALLSVALLPLGIGFVTTPKVLGAVREYAAKRREIALEWGGVRIPVVYREVPKGAGPWDRTLTMLRDPQTCRDLRWLAADLMPGFVTALLPAILAVYAVEGLAMPFGLWQVYGDDPYWYAFVPVSGFPTALAAAVLGVGFLALALRYNRTLLTAHFRLTRAVLGADHDELAERVRVLTDTRRDAVDTSAAELRRIERDLHDGAQARIVAMGMDLGTIEALIERDPATAKRLLAQARRNSAETLEELRDLVRGIHPPVLAERGLGDAVRALALRLPLPVEVTVDLEGRAEAPVESAAYFAVSELLTNVVKHASADRVWVDVHHSDGLLRISVTDNGRGGAAVGAGSGLAGVERRLGTFDGVLAVSSPAGGPTMATMEIPCVLS
ncbi:MULTISPECIES: sensor domain-containing protein [unclassified Streptomyces]|uniref:sensor histidine kinase n=1 Tax=unclassified Streptomyces TaxID=2593676 RepID=UPI000DD6F176|nr:MULTISPECIES: sensor domain-containing protein [unclassified Streptomyces]QZZ27429.1 sensor histidine kinase [Streptomyces sp. ST1015]